MSSLLAIDPGFAAKGEGCALSLFVDHILVDSWYERVDQHFSVSDHCDITIDEVIIEKPQQDARTYGVPPKVAIELTWQGAILGAYYAGASWGEVSGFTPHEWKGSEQKPIQHGRLWRILSTDERRVLGGAATGEQIDAAKRKGALDRWGRPGDRYYPKSFLMHNKLDSTALGTWYLRRLERLG